MRPYRRLLPLAVGVLCTVALVACGEQASEKPIGTLNGEGFSVKMPGEPKRSTEAVQTAAGRCS